MANGWGWQLYCHFLFIAMGRQCNCRPDRWRQNFNGQQFHDHLLLLVEKHVCFLIRFADEDVDGTQITLSSVHAEIIEPNAMIADVPSGRGQLPAKVGCDPVGPGLPFDADVVQPQGGQVQFGQRRRGAPSATPRGTTPPRSPRPAV